MTVVAVGAVLGAQAQAGTIIPMHEQTVTQNVRGSVRSVTVSGDYSNVKVLTGTSTRVTAREGWNFQQPKLTVSLRRGALKIDISCTDYRTVGGVVIVGSGDLVNDCTDDLTVTVPAAARLAVTSSGAISTSGRHAAQRLHSYSGNVTVTKAIGSVEASADSGEVMASQLRGSVVGLSSASGGVHATDLSGTQVSLNSGQGPVGANRVQAGDVSLSTDSGDVTAASVATTVLTVHSGQGALSVTDATAQSMVLTTDSGDITVQRTSCRSLVASSGQGNVHAQHVIAPTASLRSSSGDVTVQDASSTTLELTSGQGVVTTIGVRVTNLTATTDSGNINADTTNAPSEMLLNSGQGTVVGDVATGTYAVTASSGQGKVTITGLTVNSASAHHLQAHSDSGDVTVQGH
jgi:DUF4097 and DUF4098 domain-containing protein YvlB